MRKLPKKLLTAFVVTTLAGACLHFLYVLLPNPVTALLAPVNESLWEHLKIFFWPYLAAALLLTRGGERGCRAPVDALRPAAVRRHAVRGVLLSHRSGWGAVGGRSGTLCAADGRRISSARRVLPCGRADGGKGHHSSAHRDDGRSNCDLYIPAAGSYSFYRPLRGQYVGDHSILN